MNPGFLVSAALGIWEKFSKDISKTNLGVEDQKKIQNSIISYRDEQKAKLLEKETEINLKLIEANKEIRVTESVSKHWPQYSWRPFVYSLLVITFCALVIEEAHDIIPELHHQFWTFFTIVFCTGIAGRSAEKIGLFSNLLSIPNWLRKLPFFKKKK